MLLLFAADIAVDAVADFSGHHCVSESSHPGSDQDKGPCSHCSCATHNATVVLADSAVPLSVRSDREAFAPSSVVMRLPRFATTIDHPPQLA